MSWSDLPKYRYTMDPDIVEKAEAMLKQGKSHAFVSDYLGMLPTQVASISSRIHEGLKGRPPRTRLLPCEDVDKDSIWDHRVNARRGSEALLEAMRRAM